MPVVEEELKELKEEMAEYQEDVKELHQLKVEAKESSSVQNIKVSKGANHLFGKVNKMILKLDRVLEELEKSEKKIKQEMEHLLEKKESSSASAELIKIDELIATIKKFQNVPDDYRLTRITEILGKIDEDRDGSIRIADVLKVIRIKYQFFCISIRF